MQEQGKVAVVTGAGSGIGRAVAVALAGTGYRVAFTGRRVEALEEAIATVSPEHRAGCLAVGADVREPASVSELFRRVEERFGRVDLLFNNAGISAPAVPLETLRFEDWRAVVDTILTGAFLCTQEAFRIMKRQTPSGGRIINNGSISAHVPRPNSAPYTAAKHAITGLTRSTSLDGRAFDIVCGQIDIGNAATNMTAKMGVGVMQADGRIAKEPTMDVQAVVDAVLYMAGLPLSVNVPFITVMANRMPYMGRG